MLTNRFNLEFRSLKPHFHREYMEFTRIYVHYVSSSLSDEYQHSMFYSKVRHLSLNDTAAKSQYKAYTSRNVSRRLAQNHQRQSEVGFSCACNVHFLIKSYLICAYKIMHISSLFFTLIRPYDINKKTWAKANATCSQVKMMVR